MAIFHSYAQTHAHARTHSLPHQLRRAPPTSKINLRTPQRRAASFSICASCLFQDTEFVARIFYASSVLPGRKCVLEASLQQTLHLNIDVYDFVFYVTRI